MLGIKHTNAELRAKNYFIYLINHAKHEPIDKECFLPVWYNEVLFKRGQKYFEDNRFGVLTSNLYGLIILLSVPRGLNILLSTNRSNTLTAARIRYVSTILHVESWYKHPLHIGSRSWQSLAVVRNLHQKYSGKNENQKITQLEIAITIFGFMGLALVRPNLFGIHIDKIDDRKGFVHFWAVIGCMIGVKDEFNMCLHELESVEIICLIFTRYIFIPFAQIETDQFKTLVANLLDALSTFLPLLYYDVEMFKVYTVLGIPGYQYSNEHKNLIMCNAAFTVDEMKQVNGFVYEYLLMQNARFEAGNLSFIEINKSNANALNKCIETKPYIILQLNVHQRFKVVFYSDSELNDLKYKQLQLKKKILVNIHCLIVKVYKNVIARQVCEFVLDIIMKKMANFKSNL